MAKNLVIVESPAKAKTINRILGASYQVKASMGHVRDLPKSKLGVDEENDFTPSYVTLREKSKVIKELREAAKKAKTVYLATDPDREGESIGFHLRELLKNDAPEFYRVAFNEITAPAVKRAFEHAGEINVQRVEAQQARRILDRLVGYKLSPLLWNKVGKGLSAGRVQSVALRLIVDREREIRAFNIEEYWKITARLRGKVDPPFDAAVTRFRGAALELKNADDSAAAVETLQKQRFVVEKVTVKPRKRNPPPPYITSTLQQDAFRKLSFSVARTMRVAQRLYEGIDLGSQGQVALITYMRTDSTRIADEAKDAARAFIGSKFGAEFLGKGAVRKAAKGAQDAHEAIRPNYVERTPESLEGLLGVDEMKLYRLIWNRFIASQMAAAEFESTGVDIVAGEYDLRANGNRLLFPGFLAVNGKTREEDEDADAFLPPLHKGDVLDATAITPSQHFTQPPPRYSEAALVKELEERGIGRPSTYASIISTITEREYVARDAGKLLPTDLGIVVTDLLAENFTDLMDYEYTARMEQVLDRIEEGDENWVAALQRFNKGFKSDLAAAEERMRNLKREVEETDEVCEKCGKPMVIRWGRYGRFMSCSNYPECKNAKPLTNGAPAGEQGTPETDKYANIVCQKCGAPMALKRSRFGPFLGCTNYPTCNFTMRLNRQGQPVQPVDSTPIMACPACKEGQVTQKKSRRGKIFYGCNRYPKCNFALWKEPVPETCPSCSAEYLLISRSKKGDRIICSNEACDYSRPHEDDRSGGGDD